MLRLHLGLIVAKPRDRLGIRVENAVYRLREDEPVVFDDAYGHEAWNYTSQTRPVLFVDFSKPSALLHLAVLRLSSVRAWTTIKPGKRGFTNAIAGAGDFRVAIPPDRR